MKNLTVSGNSSNAQAAVFSTADRSADADELTISNNRRMRTTAAPRRWWHRAGRGHETLQNSLVAGNFRGTGSTVDEREWRGDGEQQPD